MRTTWARNCPPVASEIPRSRYSMKVRRPVLYTASCARLTLKACLLSLIDGSSVGSAAHHLARLDVQMIAPRPQRLHRLEAVLDHVAVELHAVAVGIGKVDAPGHVVGDGGVDLDAQLAQLREASELPGHVVEPRLALRGRLARGQLEERQVVMLLAHAQEHRAPVLLVVGNLEAEHSGVELLGLLHVAHLEDHVAELASLDHPCLPAPWRRSDVPADPSSPGPSIDAGGIERSVITSPGSAAGSCAQAGGGCRPTPRSGTSGEARESPAPPPTPAHH